MSTVADPARPQFPIHKNQRQASASAGDANPFLPYQHILALKRIPEFFPKGAQNEGEGSYCAGCYLDPGFCLDTVCKRPVKLFTERSHLGGTGTMPLAKDREHKLYPGV